MDSILQSERVCYITGQTNNLHKHHIYFGNPLRRISEENGFWCWLRWDWHNGSDYGVHFNRELDLQLKQMCQEEYEKTHSREEFIRLIGKSYL
jgi:hypothetical protein